MDTSERYIEMCRTAKVLQNGWAPQAGDYIFRCYSLFGTAISKEWESIEILTGKTSIEGYYHATDDKGNTFLYKSFDDVTKATSVWLPRQDQLQSMLFRTTGLALMKEFNVWLSENELAFDNIEKWPSIDELWLRMVMAVKYRKFWGVSVSENFKETWIESVYMDPRFPVNQCAICGNEGAQWIEMADGHERYFCKDHKVTDEEVGKTPSYVRAIMIDSVEYLLMRIGKANKALSDNNNSILRERAEKYGAYVNIKNPTEFQLKILATISELYPMLHFRLIEGDRLLIEKEGTDIQKLLKDILISDHLQCVRVSKPYLIDLIIAEIKSNELC